MTRPLACTVLLVLELLLSVAPAHANTTSPCSDADDWAAACARTSPLDVSIVYCADGVLVVDTQNADGVLLRVEIGPHREGAFRRSGDLGLWLVGVSSDDTRTLDLSGPVLDALETCLDESLETTVAALPEPEPGRSTAPSEPPAKPVPWRALVGLLAGLVLVVRLPEDHPLRAAGARPAIVFLIPATLALRRGVVAPGFFHQNGHGPGWVDQALCRDSGYGPGYRELFGWALDLGPAPDLSVMGLQALLSAMAVAAFAVTLVCLGLRLRWAFTLGLVLALEPLGARLALSESYFAVGSTTGLLATAMLALAATSRTRGALALGLFGAAALVAQAARIHPLLWVPLALVTLPLLAGTDRGRIRLYAGATLAVGTLVAALAGSSMAASLQADLGQQWLPGGWAQNAARSGLHTAVPAAALAALLLALSRSRRASLPGGMALVAVGFAVGASDLLGPVLPAVRQAHRLQFLAPAAVAVCLAALPGQQGLRWSRSATVAGVALLALGLGVRFARPLPVPTDRQEQALWMSWRSELPAVSRVHYLGQSGLHNLDLPLRPDCAPANGLPLGVKFRVEDLDPARRLSPGSYLYHSSVCSTERARGACAAFLAGRPLRVVHEERLPAVPSMSYLDYDSPEVHVALYEVLP